MDISKKKPSYPISPALRRYLADYDRAAPLPVTYADLLRYSGSYPRHDRNGHDTLWQTVYYEPSALRELSEGLVAVYARERRVAG